MIYVAKLPDTAVVGATQGTTHDLSARFLGAVGQLLGVGGMQGVGMIHLFLPATWVAL